MSGRPSKVDSDFDLGSPHHPPGKQVAAKMSINFTPKTSNPVA